MIASLIAAAAIQSADFDTGLGLLRTCRDEPYRMLCYGYIRGFGDGAGLSAALRNTPRLFCTPETITLEELRQVLVEDLEKDRTLWSMNGMAAYVVVLNRNFPCPTSGG